jgi:proline dehydrogenase
MVWLFISAAVLAGLAIGIRFYRLMLTSYVAAEDEAGAIRAMGRLLHAGYHITSDPLGEFTADAAKVPDILAFYERHVEKLDGLARTYPNRRISIAIKPSRFAFEADWKTFFESLRHLVAKAQDHGIFIWVDAEKQSMQEGTVKAVMTLRGQGRMNVGLAIQSMHVTSFVYARRLASLRIPIRVVKGAYADGDIDAPRMIDDLFLKICHRAAFHAPKNRPYHLAVGTHDEILLARAMHRAAWRKDLTFESQFLFGVRPALQELLLSRGYETLIYLPWGSRKEASGFFRRRLKEGIRPKTIFLFIRNLSEARRFRKKYLD